MSNTPKKFMIVKAKNEEQFRGEVFGGDCFVEYWPDILTKGIIVAHINEFYYVVNTETLKLAGDSAFFTEDELQYLDIIKSIEVPA